MYLYVSCFLDVPVCIMFLTSTDSKSTTDYSSAKFSWQLVDTFNTTLYKHSCGQYKNIYFHEETTKLSQPNEVCKTEKRSLLQNNKWKLRPWC